MDVHYYILFFYENCCFRIGGPENCHIAVGEQCHGSQFTLYELFLVGILQTLTESFCKQTEMRSTARVFFLASTFKLAQAQELNPVKPKTDIINCERAK